MALRKTEMINTQNFQESIIKKFKIRLVTYDKTSQNISIFLCFLESVTLQVYHDIVIKFKHETIGQAAPVPLSGFLQGMDYLNVGNAVS